MAYKWTPDAMRGGTSCEVDVIADNLMHLKYDNVSSQDGKAPYSVNSAKVNSSGYANFIDKVDDSSVIIYAGSSNPNIVQTDVNGKLYTTSSNYTISDIEDDGIYSLVQEFDKEDGTALNPVVLKTGQILQTPQMTSNTTPSGVASASTVYSTPNHDAWKAFNRTNIDAYDCWQSSSAPSAGTPQWLKYDFGSGFAKKATKIVVVNRNNPPPSSPNTFTFEGSNDNTNWTTLLTVTNDTNVVQAGRREFSFSNTTAYRYYKLNITARNGSAGYVDVGELEIYEVNNSIKELPVLPETVINGDYITVTSVKPMVQYKGVNGVWEETLFNKLGEFTKTSGVIATPISYAFNLTTNTGWFAVTSGTTYTKNHNLGTKEFTYYVEIADDSNGTNARPIFPTNSNSFYCGATTATTLSIVTNANVGVSITGSSLTSAYYRITAYARCK